MRDVPDHYVLIMLLMSYYRCKRNLSRICNPHVDF
uniref:Uncharacterized protein n=1 Tax=Arundo donax TaxID=35708 RepID=A0A0A9HRY9_ARUDO